MMQGGRNKNSPCLFVWTMAPAISILVISDIPLHHTTWATKRQFFGSEGQEKNRGALPKKYVIYEAGTQLSQKCQVWDAIWRPKKNWSLVAQVGYMLLPYLGHLHFFIFFQWQDVHVAKFQFICLKCWLNAHSILNFRACRLNSWFLVIFVLGDTLKIWSKTAKSKN